ncbi:HIT-like domain-containing protein [Ephemerocybe angulata]|uniref:HIT-like domain-containing protein n=1 Tax=Ephemerocybe angulata TaxID=980116 RepID=A0A8H6IJ45_9AGAR|nr:HIT-like domain-containing protein [Tulosesus angulatus]
MANLTILRTYALKDPANISPSVLFRSSEKFLTIFDAYPKSIFHFLVLPRLTKDEGGFSEGDTANLKALLKADKQKAKELIESMKAEALEVKKEMEEEMVERYGYKWDSWVGFHAVPSMVHLHLHVLAADLVSERMKNKKHYNSFHPSLGFFLHVDEVLSWFDADTTYFNRMAQLTPKPYEDLLKRDLECWCCRAGMKNIPKLKEHLQEEWDKHAVKAKRAAQKRKATSDGDCLSVPQVYEGSASKRAKTAEPEPVE